MLIVLFRKLKVWLFSKLMLFLLILKLQVSLVILVLVITCLGGWFGIYCPSAFFKVSRNVRVIYPKNRPNQTTNYWLITTRVHKVPFHFFDKLKYEIRNKILILVSILKLRGIKHQTKWFFHFQNNWALYLQIWSSFSIFHLNLKNEKPNCLSK